MVAEDAVCYRHPDRLASVGCQRCDRPICSSCMKSASVGFHCPECTKSGAQQVFRARDLGPNLTPVYALIAVNVLAFIAQSATSAGAGVTSGEVYREGVLWGVLVQLDEYWRLVTGGFLHGSLLHIGLNMYMLYLFGPEVIRGVGPLRMLLIYFGGLLGGSLAVVAFNFTTPTLGASGAVLGLAGGLAAILWSRGISITQTSLGGLFLLNLALPLLIGGISFWGHLGGIVGGFAIGWLVSFLPIKFRVPDASANAVAIAAVIALGVLGILAAELGEIPASMLRG